MKKIAVLISGSGSNLEAIIDACNQNIIDGDVIKVISNNPKAYGLVRAKKFNISSKTINHKNFDSREDFDQALEDSLVQINPDVIVLAGFMRILGKKITKNFGNIMINLHPSLLPLYPGLNTHEKVLLNKDKIHGVSIHYVSSELDAGPLIAQGVIKIKGNETLDELTERIHKVEHLLLPEIINLIINKKVTLKNEIVKFEPNNQNDKKFIVKNYAF